MRLSLIIPCFNAGAYVEQAIRSVVTQTRPPDELIVVDDGSTDGSREAIGSFGEAVRLVEGSRAGAAAARAKGAGLATGDALVFLDADDLLAPETLEALMDALGRRPEAVALCPWFRLSYEGGRWVQRRPSSRPRLPRQDPLTAWLGGWYHPPCSVAWSRAGYERAGGWDPRISVNDDGDLMMRALAAGVPLVESRIGRAFYRRARGDEQTLSGARNTEAGLRSRLGVLTKLLRQLEEQSLLHRYRIPLGLAFDAIATTSGDELPGLRDEAEAHAEQLAGSRRNRERHLRRRQYRIRLYQVSRELRHPRQTFRRVAPSVPVEILSPSAERNGEPG